MPRKAVCIIIAGIFLLAIGLREKREPLQELYAVFSSPNKSYRLEVYAYSGYSSFPGQGSDAPGKVFLKDRDGRILNSTEIEMIQLVYNPEWSSGGVRVNLILDWPTPLDPIK